MLVVPGGTFSLLHIQTLWLCTQQQGLASGWVTPVGSAVDSAVV